MKFFALFLGIFYTLFALFPQPTANAARPECSEEMLRISGVLVVTCEENNVCPANPTSARETLGTVAAGASIYMLGDSISVLSENKLRESIESRGYTISGFNADGGRAITYDSGGSPLRPAGIETVAIDANIIRDSDVVIVALGTNSGQEDLTVQIPTLVQSIRNTGFTGRLYWVDLFYKSRGGPDIRNAIIEDLHDDLSYTVIKASQATIELEPSDEIHPNTTGQGQFAEVVGNALASIPTPVNLTKPNSDGQCQCVPRNSGSIINNTITWGEGVWGPGTPIYSSGLTGPYTMEQWAIHVLKNISLKAGISESEMVTQPKVVSLIAWARAEGGGVNGNNGTFNPLNTKLDHNDLNGVNQGNAATDSNSQGYPSFDIGVEAITRGLFGRYQKRIGSALLQPSFPQDALIEAIAGDFYSPDGTEVINRLEDIYPGDKAYATLSITGFDYGGGIGDRALYVSIKRDTLEEVRSNYEKYASVILDGSPSGTPEPLVFSGGGVTGTSLTGAACSQEGGGSVSTDGYSFPLEPQTRGGIGGVTAGQVASSHWDESPAYDLFGPVDADVYSIYSGTPVKINTSFNDIPGCTSIQFQADDGFFYFYGHLKNPTVVVGQRIESGVKMAEIADSSFGSGCTGGGGPHLHIDRGCVTAEGPQWGGGRDCRDPDFIEFLSKLYETLE